MMHHLMRRAMPWALLMAFVLGVVMTMLEILA